MTEPQGYNLTYGHMLAIAARIAGDEIVDSDGALVPPPVGTEPRARAERVVNRAMRHVMGERSDWSFLRVRFELTFAPDGDGGHNINNKAWQYAMPWSFTGTPLSQWVFDGQGPVGFIETIGWSELEKLRASVKGTYTGDPRVAAFTSMAQASTGRMNRPLYTVGFYPTPSSARTVSILYRADLARWAHEDEQLAFGADYADVIEKAVEMYAAREAAPSLYESLRRDYAEALSRAAMLEGEKRPDFPGALARTMTRGRYSQTAYDPRADAATATVYGTVIRYR